MTKVQFLDSENVRVLTEISNTILHMDKKTFDALQKIINGEVEIVKDLDTTNKKMFNTTMEKGQFKFEHCGQMH